MPRARVDRPRPRPVALGIVILAVLCTVVAVVVVGRPNRALATSAEADPANFTAPSLAVEAPPPSTPTPAPSPATAPPPPPPPAPTAPTGAYKVTPVKDGGTITGTCRLGADVKVWQVAHDKDNAKGCGEPMHATERMIVGPDRALANCVVFLRSIRAGKDFPEAMRGEDRRLLVDQKTCHYVPHVAWAREATQIVVGNSDLAEHNIHGFKGSISVTQFNFSSKPQSVNEGEEAAYLAKADVYILKCDIHPWMSGYLHVTPHPYYDVTSAQDDGAGKKAGQFVLADVPPGDWEVVCWHEGMKEDPIVVNGKISGYTYGLEYVSPPQKVTVAPGKTSTVDFVVPAP